MSIKGMTTAILTLSVKSRVATIQGSALKDDCPTSNPGRNPSAFAGRPRTRQAFATLLVTLAALMIPASSSLHVAAQSTPRTTTRPNIVFIMADDLGYADIGSFGQTKISTPNLDRLATQSTRFTNVYAGATVCAPSRCVLMTGLHTGHCRVRANSSRASGQGRRVSLTNEDRTVAEALHDAGYVTGAIGKWGIGEDGTDGIPNKRGFDEWFGYLNQNHAPFYYTDYLWRNEQKQMIPENSDGKRVRYSHDLMADEAVSFVQRHKDKPFFLYLPFTIPHRQFEVPSLGKYANEPWPEEAKIFAAMVTRLDRDVGRVLDELDKQGLSKNTVVFFTSDNGSEKKKTFGDFFKSAGPFRDYKGSVYEGGLRVPMLVRWPGVVPTKKVSSATWWFPDVYPTLLAIAGVKESTAKLDGLNVVPTLRGRTQSGLTERFLYWENPESKLVQGSRWGDWKAVRLDAKAPLELYNLKDDVGETRNVAALHPDIVAQFEKFLAGARTPSPYWPL